MRKIKQTEANIKYYSRVYSSDSKKVLELKEKLKILEEELRDMK